MLVLCLLVLPFGATANAAPVLTGATLSYSDDVGPIGPIAVDVTLGQSPELCGAAGAVSCKANDLTNLGILLEDDFIEFTGTFILFDFEGGGDQCPSPNEGYRDLGLSANATFTMTGLAFSEGGVLAGVTPVLTNVIGVSPGTEVTFTGNSQLLPISQNQALFARLGTQYGGNGTTNFALPDLRGRVPIGYASSVDPSHQPPGVQIGQAAGTEPDRAGAGTENVTLLSSQIPSHGHAQASTLQATSPQPSGNVPAGQPRRGVARYEARHYRAMCCLLKGALRA